MPPRGTKRLPADVLDARGAFDRHPERRREDVEPDGPLGDPFDWLDAQARAIWIEQASHCPPGWLASTDRYAFARWALLTCKLVNNTLTNEDNRQISTLEARFGFTPTERTRVKPPAKSGKKDPFKEALGIS